MSVVKQLHINTNSMFFTKKHCFVFSFSIPSRNACVHSLRPPLLGGACVGISLTSQCCGWTSPWGSS